MSLEILQHIFLLHAPFFFMQSTVQLSEAFFVRSQNIQGLVLATTLSYNLGRNLAIYYIESVFEIAISCYYYKYCGGGPLLFKSKHRISNNITSYGDRGASFFSLSNCQFRIVTMCLHHTWKEVCLHLFTPYCVVIV